MTRSAVIAAISLASLLGCTVHLDRNAPGRADIRTPPAQTAPFETERPDDPGERMILASIGGFGGIGFRAGGQNNGAHESGVEISIDYGEKDRSHEAPDLFPMAPIPDRRFGVNIGLVIAEATRRNFDDTELGPLYLEAHWAEPFASISAGYSFDLRDNSHGPQVAVMAYGLYAKASYRLERGLDVTFGVVYKFPVAFVWSR